MIYIGPQIFSFSQACHGTRLKATCNIFLLLHVNLVLISLTQKAPALCKSIHWFTNEMSFMMQLYIPSKLIFKQVRPVFNMAMKAPFFFIVWMHGRVFNDWWECLFCIVGWKIYSSKIILFVTNFKLRVWASARACKCPSLLLNILSMVDVLFISLPFWLRQSSKSNQFLSSGLFDECCLNLINF
jgi:hypothetical protein